MRHFIAGFVSSFAPTEALLFEAGELLAFLLKIAAIVVVCGGAVLGAAQLLGAS